MGSREGVEKGAAARLGLSLEQYRANLAAGLKHCTKCKAWKLRELFDPDRTRGDGLAARCRDCDRVKTRKQRIGGAPSKKAQRDAGNAVSRAVAAGRMAPATTLPCLDCGKPAKEYHHHLGYSAAHWLDVVALCRSCHRRRHWA